MYGSKGHQGTYVRRDLKPGCSRYARHLATFHLRRLTLTAAICSGPPSAPPDFDSLEKRSRGIALEGLSWGEARRVPFAFGIEKLELACVFRADQVMADNVLAALMCALGEDIQHAELVSLNNS